MTKIADHSKYLMYDATERSLVDKAPKGHTTVRLGLVVDRLVSFLSTSSTSKLTSTVKLSDRDLEVFSKAIYIKIRDLDRTERNRMIDALKLDESLIPRLLAHYHKTCFPKKPSLSLTRSECVYRETD